MTSSNMANGFGCKLLKKLYLNGRGERIRTSDPLVPNQVRYQTALRPELLREMSVEDAIRVAQALGWACWIRCTDLVSLAEFGEGGCEAGGDEMLFERRRVRFWS